MPPPLDRDTLATRQVEQCPVAKCQVLRYQLTHLTHNKVVSQKDQQEKSRDDVSLDIQGQIPGVSTRDQALRCWAWQ